MKVLEKEMARALRREGFSVKEICEKVKVSLGSVSVWVRDIELTEDQKIKLEAKNPVFNRACKGAKSQKDNSLIKRESYQKEGRDLAKNKDHNFIAGCMLYWAEGDKSRNVVGLSNTDENMLRFFVDFLKNNFGVTENEFSIYVHWYSDSHLSLNEIQEYWLKKLDLPSSCIRKFQLDNVSKYSQKKKKNRHPFGTCHVKVGRTDVVQKIYGAIQGFVGFKNETWVL